jgi:RNA polymerase sigma-54 factor
MPLALQQVQKLSQRLIMTPQMQQSVKLLQMNTIELEAMTDQELLENPFLEIDEEVEIDQERTEIPDISEIGEVTESVEFGDSDNTDETSARDDYETFSETANASDGTLTENPIDEDVIQGSSEAIEDHPDQFSEMDTDWSEIFDDNETRNYAPPSGDPAEERSMEETVAGSASLYEHLEWQLRVSALEGLDAKIGAYLIGCINEDGYLETTLEECAEHFKVSLETVERVLLIVQEFDPPGVGARNLPECLCLQLDSFGALTPLAKRVLTNHWPDLLRRKFHEIARETEASEEEIIRIFEKVGRLEPKPGHHYTKEQPHYITPDVYVKEIEGRYICYLNEGRIAHLRLSDTYKQILLDDPKNRDTDERQYAVDKYRAAVMFIKNIEKRRSTVLRVTEAIMEYQRDFLEHGVSALHPLSLTDIAQVVGMDESTISRVTSSKYVDTPQGLFLLKYFFSSGIDYSDGNAVSSRAVKQNIRDLIEKEDPAHPLSDDKLAKILKSQGFTLARRTVAKYREQLKILPTNLRKQTR